MTVKRYKQRKSVVSTSEDLTLYDLTLGRKHSPKGVWALGMDMACPAVHLLVTPPQAQSQILPS